MNKKTNIRGFIFHDLATGKTYQVEATNETATIKQIDTINKIEEDSGKAAEMSEAGIRGIIFNNGAKTYKVDFVSDLDPQIIELTKEPEKI